MIEQAPAWSDGAERGVVAEGSVGARATGRFRVFRYEVRRWRDGVIPDLAEAVESPRRLSDDPDCARRLLELVPEAPTPVWGRDELGAGEMWNSNSLISWLIARSGLAVHAIHPPTGRTGSRLASRHRHRVPPAGTREVIGPRSSAAQMQEMPRPANPKAHRSLTGRPSHSAASPVKPGRVVRTMAAPRKPIRVGGKQVHVSV